MTRSRPPGGRVPVSPRPEDAVVDCQRRRCVRDHERLSEHHEAMVLWAMIILMGRGLAPDRGRTCRGGRRSLIEASGGVRFGTLTPAPPSTHFRTSSGTGGGRGTVRGGQHVLNALGGGDDLIHGGDPLACRVRLSWPVGRKCRRWPTSNPSRRVRSSPTPVESWRSNRGSRRCTATLCPGVPRFN
jgi:hypothetical protein